MTDNAELRALHEAATQAPWRLHGRVFVVPPSYPSPHLKIALTEFYEDAVFIAAMRNELPRLLDDSDKFEKLWDYVGHKEDCRWNAVIGACECTCGLAELAEE